MGKQPRWGWGPASPQQDELVQKRGIGQGHGIPEMAPRSSRVKNVKHWEGAFHGESVSGGTHDSRLETHTPATALGVLPVRDTPSTALLSPGRAEPFGHWRRGAGAPGCTVGAWGCQACGQNCFRSEFKCVLILSTTPGFSHKWENLACLRFLVKNTQLSLRLMASSLEAF